MKERLSNIDCLKFIATMAIFNHLAQKFYGQYTMLATGGAIGCALFFFCSGYTLSLGKLTRFDSWYKRRLARLWPTCFVVVLFRNCIGVNATVLHALRGAGWFVSCVLIHYVILYVIRRWLKERYGLSLIMASLVMLCWYLMRCWQGSEISLFGEDYFKWGHGLLFMLIGAFLAQRRERAWSVVWCAAALCVGVVAFYAGQYFLSRNPIYSQYQGLLLFPLGLKVVSLYGICHSGLVSKIMQTKLGVAMMIIGGLSLELYLTAKIVFSYIPDIVFPFSYIAGFVGAAFVAYLLRAAGRVFAQTLDCSRLNYDWCAVFRIY